MDSASEEGPMTARPKRDLGKDLDQAKVADDHRRIEGYDVYTFAHCEGTHTSRGADIERDGTPITRRLDIRVPASDRRCGRRGDVWLGGQGLFCS